VKPPASGLFVAPSVEEKYRSGFNASVGASSEQLDSRLHGKAARASPHLQQKQTVLVLWDDLQSAEALCKNVLAVNSHAQCEIVASVSRSETILTTTAIDLFITSIDSSGGDALDLLFRCNMLGRRPRRILVLLKQPTARVAITLRELAVDGVFDFAAECGRAFESCLRTIDSGRPSWSQAANARFCDADSRMVLYQLTTGEQLALAIMGGGCSDQDAAARMGVTYHTARKIRHRLHIKLDVHDREGLICAAARLGYTRLTDKGIVPLGLAILIGEHESRRVMKRYRTKAVIRDADVAGFRRILIGTFP